MVIQVILDLQHWRKVMTQEQKPTTVRAGLRFVRNLGNYETITVELAVEDSVRQGENVSSAMDRVYEFVEEQLVERMQEIEADLNGKK